MGDALLEIREPARRASTSKPILRGVDLVDPRRRGPRRHGPERLGQEHARERARGPRGLRSHRRRGALPRPATCSALAPEERAREGVFLAFQYPVEIPGVGNSYFMKASAERGARSARSGAARRDRLPRAREAEGEGARDGRGVPVALGERGLLGRREEAQRDPADGAARARARGARRDRLRARHRRAAHRGRRREPAALAASARCSRSRTTSGCSTTSSPTARTC